MATASLNTTPTVLDAGTSASISIKNTGNTYVVITNGPERVTLRPSRDITLIPNGAVAASVPADLGGSGSITYDVAGKITQVLNGQATTAVQQLIAQATGTATLVAGTKVVTDAAITATSVIRLSSKSTTGTPGAVYVSARTPGTSFTITSTSGTDTSTIQYEIVSY